MNNTIVVTKELVQDWKRDNLTKLSDITRKLRNRSKRNEVPEALEVYNLIDNFSLPVKELYPTLHKILPQKFTKSNEDFNEAFTVKSPTTNDANKSHIIAKALLTVVPNDVSTQNWLFNKECQKYMLGLITTHNKEIENKDGEINEIKKEHATIMQKKDEEVKKAKEKLEKEDKIRTKKHEMKIDEIKKEHATIIQKKDDEIKKAREKFEEEAKVKANLHEKEINEIKKDHATIIQEKDDEVRKTKEKLEEKAHLSTSSVILLHDIVADIVHEKEIEEIKKDHATIMQEKDDEVRKANEKLEEKANLNTSSIILLHDIIADIVHEKEIEEIKKDHATIMQEKDDEVRKANKKLEEEVDLSTSSIILPHDTVAKNKDDTVESLKGKKQLESKHDVDIEEETINNKTWKKTKEISQNVLKAKEAKIKETPKQVDTNYAKTKDEAIENPTREKQETNKISTKKGKTVVKAIRSSKFTNKVKDKRMSFFSSKNMKTAKLNKTIHYLQTCLLKARYDSKKLTEDLKQKSKALASQLQEKEKDFAKVTRENIEYKTRITNITKTNCRLKEKEKDLAKVTNEKITGLAEENYQLEALVNVKNNKIVDYESYYGRFVKETTKISQDFAVDKVHDILNEIMSSIKQVQEKFDKDAEMKNLGPKVSDLKRAFSQNIPDISFLEIKQDAGSIKRKKVTPIQHAKKQRRT